MGKTGLSCYIKMMILIVAGMMIAGGVAKAEIVDRIIAVVNDEIISLSDFNRVFEPYEEKIKTAGYPADKTEEMLSKVREDILNQLIEQKLADQEIKRLKIAVSEEEIDQAIEHIKKTRYYTDEELRQILKTEGFTMAEYREQVRDQLLRSKLVNYEIKSKIVVTQEDIEKYYHEHSDEYMGEKKYHLRNIILTIPPYSDDRDKQEIRQRLESILEEIKAGADFSEMAARYSESSLAADGGNLGFFTLDELAPEIKKEIELLAPNDVSPIIETDQGFQIFYVEEIQEAAGKPTEEVAPEIEHKLYNQIIDEKYQSWIDGLREDAHIRIIR